jgi:hypothetical protein
MDKTQIIITKEKTRRKDMKKKKIFALIAIIIIIGAVIYSVIQNRSNQSSDPDEISEYTPEQEISDEQLRETILTLYFLDAETQTLKSEGKLVDSSVLLNNPYKLIVQSLIDGPKSDTLQSVFPENTRIIDASIEKNCVILNFSEELLNFEDDTQKYNIINSILNSLTQLTEVNSIKFLVNGEISDKMNEEYSAL